MRGVLAAYGDMERAVWVADSFQGFPPTDAQRYPLDANEDWHRGEFLSVSYQVVRANFARYGLLDSQVRFLPGWFRDTLPSAPVERLAILRLDGDMYGSTWETLAVLYSKVVPGGFVIIDDYSIGSCRAAVTDFRAQNNIADPIEMIDWTGAFWRTSH